MYLYLFGLLRGDNAHRKEHTYIIDFILLMAKYYFIKFSNRKPQIVAFNGGIKQYIQSIQYSVKHKAIKMISACTLFNVLLWLFSSMYPLALFKIVYVEVLL